ncbi:peptidase, partial [Streptococcus agalactiae]
MFSKARGTQYDASQTKQRFSIKKFKFGAASVLVGLLFLGMNSHSVLADESSAMSAEVTQAAEVTSVDNTINSDTVVSAGHTENINPDDVVKISESGISEDSNISSEDTDKVNDLGETVSEKDITVPPVNTMRSIDDADESLEKASVDNNRGSEVSGEHQNKEEQDTVYTLQDTPNKQEYSDKYQLPSRDSVDKPKVRSRRSLNLSDRESSSQEFPLGSAEYVDKAHLIVTKNNMVDHFEVRGTAHGDDQNPVVLTEDVSGQAGSLLLNKRIDMNESFRLEGRLSLGDKYEGYNVGGRSGGDGVSFAFTSTAPGTIGLSGASIGLGGLPNSFGFKFDTWHNTSNPNVNQKAGADPKFSGYQNGAFGAFYGTDASGKAITLLQDARRLESQPHNNEFKNVIVDYNGQSKAMTVTYDGQIFTKNIQTYLDKSRLTTNQAKGREELGFAIFASTGSGTNLQQFDLTRFEYSSGGSYIKLLYVDDSTGNVIKEKLYSGLTYQSLDLSDKLMLPNYTFKRTNAPTAVGYQDSNTINFNSGIQTITYTYKKVEKEELQRLLDNDSNLKLTDIYVNADKTKQTAYDDSIKKGQVVVNDSFTSQDKVDDAVKIITDSIVALRVSAAEAAVKAAEDAAQAGKDKKAEVEADGVVNPDEKSAVDGLNDVTTEKKGTATPLVDSLPEGPVKEALKARLDQVTTSEVTVNDADSNGKPDSQDAAEAAAEAAVKAAEDAAQAGKDKKAEVEADGVVNPDEKSAVDGLNDVTTEKKGTATPLVDSLPEGPVKEALKARLDQVTTSEVTVNDADSNG